MHIIYTEVLKIMYYSAELQIMLDYKVGSSARVGVPGWHFCLFAADAQRCTRADANLICRDDTECAQCAFCASTRQCFSRKRPFSLPR